MYCSTCGSQLPEGTAVCTYCGAAQRVASAPAQNTLNNAKDNTPMKWFKFLIWFSLFASAVLNGISGFQLLTGAHYGGESEAELVYKVFSDMKTVDTIAGIALIAAAALALYTRFRLAGFYKNGPAMLMLTYAVNVIIPVVYVLGAKAALGSYGDSLDLTSNYSSIITSVAMIFINKTYFDKRAHLFTK